MGSVKVTVFGRIKPCPKNLLCKEYSIKHSDHEDCISFSSPKIPSAKKCYRFRKVFRENADQEQIFRIVAKPIIENVLSGYNGTIFTYGQTGSGKTYTMTGDIEKWVHPGLIPQTIQEIFKSKTKDTVVYITYCEIYNEHVYDLIRIDRMDADFPQVSILEDSAGITHFRNLSVHVATSAFEALQLLVKGDANKMVAETASNAKSSRSHVIFSLTLDLPHPTQEKLYLKPVLYLVDLAGSEKLSKSKTLTNPWETRYINLSLHYLEQVLLALRQPGRAHIPYRNSLMTALLRNSLGGNCITAMIATFSLTDDDIEETIQTCRFAERIALIKNEVKLNEIENPQKEIDLLKRENQKLKEQIKLMASQELLEELSSRDKEKCAQIVQNYIEDSEYFDFPMSDVKKMEYCLWLMREEIKQRREPIEEENQLLDLFKSSLLPSDHSLNQNSHTKLKFSLKEDDSNVEKNWRRKRNPIDLPKVNITYKRWKSTENLKENENSALKKINNYDSKLEKSQVVSANDCLGAKTSSDKSFTNPLKGHLNFDKFRPPESIFKESVKQLFIKNNCVMEGLKLAEIETENEKSVTLKKLSSVKEFDESNPMVWEEVQDKSDSRVRYPLEKLNSVSEKRIEDVKSPSEKENSLDLSVSKNTDKTTSDSDESSQFSTNCLPLTGDAEVDEEIVKFYKARYDLFKKV